MFVVLAKNVKTEFFWNGCDPTVLLRVQAKFLGPASAIHIAYFIVLQVSSSPLMTLERLFHLVTLRAAATVEIG